MSLVRNSLYVSFVENYTITFFQFVSSIIIARILTPADIGVFSIAVLLSGLAGTVRDFGVTQYLIQEKELTDDKVRAAMALSLAVGWSLAMVLYLLSDPVARFYREPGVSSAVVVLAWTFVLVPFGSVVMAMLRRRLDYWSIFKVRVGSALVTATASVVLALLGFGYMSLAWSALGGVIATSAALRIAPPRRDAQAAVLCADSPGAFVLGPGRAQQCHRGGLARHPRASRRQGARHGGGGAPRTALGLRALLDKVLMSALWSVVLPYFSKLEREQGDLRASYSRVQAYVTGIAWPLMLFLGAAAGPIIAVLYGPQWGASVPLVRVVCIAGVLAATLPFFSAVLLARGRADATLKMQLVCAPLRLACVIATAPFGLIAVCIAMVASSAFDLLCVYRLLRQATSLTWRDLIDGSSRSFAVMMVSGIGPIGIGFMADRTTLTPPLALLIASLSAAAGWLAGLYLFRHPVRDEIATIVHRLRRHRRKR
jgi:O-antigen/teichoic acid export membrane protein